MALDTAINMDNTIEKRDLFLDLGKMVLTIAVLVILITAPIGAVAIMLSAPKLLKKTGAKEESFHSAREDIQSAVSAADVGTGQV